MGEEVADGIQCVKVPSPDGHKEAEACSNNQLPGLHQQPLERVASAKYLGIQLTGGLHWGKHAQSTAAKANRTSVFTSRNLKGCPPQVDSHCYKGLVRLVLEYASVMWDK